MKVLVFFIKLAVFIAFIVFEHRIYTEYKKSRDINTTRKNVINKEIKDSFLLREEGFYLDKSYLKKYEQLKKNPPESIKAEGA